MVTAEATACGGYFSYTGFVHGPWCQLFIQHLVIKIIITRPVGGGDPFVVPGKPVEAIRAINFYQTLVNKPPCCIDQPFIFILEIFALRGWEKDDWVAACTEYQHLHIEAKVV